MADNKSKKRQCAVPNCLKRISLIDEIIAKCKCGLKFCILHRQAENHECSYDFKSEIDIKGFIEKNKCVAVKI
jgi:hypothetical protein